MVPLAWLAIVTVIRRESLETATVDEVNPVNPVRLTPDDGLNLQLEDAVRIMVPVPVSELFLVSGHRLEQYYYI